MKPRKVYVVERYGIEDALVYADFDTASIVASRLIANVHPVPLVDVESDWFDRFGEDDGGKDEGGDGDE